MVSCDVDKIHFFFFLLEGERNKIFVPYIYLEMVESV